MDKSVKRHGTWLLLLALLASACGGPITSNPQASGDPDPAQSQSNAMPWNQWEVPTQTFSGTGAQDLVITAKGNYPRLLTFSFTGDGWHSASSSGANIIVSTEGRRASVVWDPLFGNSATFKVDTKGSWSMTLQSLSMAPSWDSGTPLTITDGQAVFKVAASLNPGTTTKPIAWQATGCPVSTADKQVWLPGGGGINGQWFTELGEKRGALIIVQYIYRDGKMDWMGSSGGSLDSQSTVYSGSATPRDEVVVIMTWSDCQSLVLKVSN